jgi:hypothetical protein
MTGRLKKKKERKKKNEETTRKAVLSFSKKFKGIFFCY